MIYVFFATSTGQSQDLAQRLHARIPNNLTYPYLCPLNRIDLVKKAHRTDYKNEKNLILVVMPTYGDGEAPDQAKVC
ncbi:MAG: Nitric oxide synthase, inducible, partial [Paramarteilia canceri]